MMMEHTLFAGRGFRFTAKKVYRMGILNYTPDSFFDGGRWFNVPDAVAHAKDIAMCGADILDIGTRSTRPGCCEITVEEEFSRLREVLPAVCSCVQIPVSVDTYNPKIARYALENHAVIVNDVSGMFHEKMAAVIKEFNAGWIITHNPTGYAADELDYPEGVCESVRTFFMDFTRKAEAYGIAREQICLDPGFGFGKNTTQNKELLINLQSVKMEGYALMAALSRKRFVRELFGEDGTEVANDIAVNGGADILRVHEV